MKPFSLLLALTFTAAALFTSTASAAGISGTYKFKNGSGGLNVVGLFNYNFTTEDLKNYGVDKKGKAKISGKSLHVNLQGMRSALSKLPGTIVVTGPSKIKLKKVGRKYKGSGVVLVDLSGEFNETQYEANFQVVLNAEVKGDKLTVRAPASGNLTQPVAVPVIGNAKIVLQR